MTRSTSLLRRSYVDHFTVRLEEPHLAAVFELAKTDAVGLAGLRIEDRHLRDVQRHLLFDDAAGQPAHRVGALVLLDLVRALDDQALGVEHAQHGAALALVLSGGDAHIVALFDLAHGVLLAGNTPSLARSAGEG